jgi:FkbM family methyltransferase
MRLMVKKSLPKWVVRHLINFKNNYLYGFSTRSYSQEGEDMILRRIFGSQTSGFYIDVGAHHPKRFSNTYFFYKKGWAGINIDAMPGSMKAFQKLRYRDINIETPISSTPETVVYYGFNEPALNGFSKNISESRDGVDGYRIEFTKRIKTSTLQTVLDQNLEVNQEIDFLTIDVEGLDYDVLKSLDLKRYRPRVILIEIIGSSLAEIANNEIYCHLIAEGYDLYAKSVNTVIFVSREF